jgi:hypothetical protein
VTLVKGSRNLTQYNKTPPPFFLPLVTEGPWLNF